MKKAEDIFHESIPDYQMKLGKMHWLSAADIEANEVEILHQEPQKKWEKIFRAGRLRFLLPPEGFLTTNLRLSEKNLSFTRFDAKDIFISYDALRVQEGNLFMTLYLLPFFKPSENINPLEASFQGHFSAKKISFSSNNIEDFKGYFCNVPQEHLISKGVFLWKKSPFAFASRTSGVKTDIYLTGKDIDVKDFISEKIVATSFFTSRIHFQIEENKITYLSAVFRPQEAGILEEFDITSLTQVIPENQIKPVKDVMDKFQKYPYTTGQIEFEYKDSDFTMDFQFAGSQSRYQPHLTIPIHNVKEAHQFIKLKIFPIFIREFSSIIPYLK